MKNINIYLSNHRFYPGIEDLVTLISDIMTTSGWVVRSSYRLNHEEINIVIEEFTDQRTIEYIEGIKKSVPEIKLVLLATEFPTVAKNFRSFNLFQKINIYWKFILQTGFPAWLFIRHASKDQKFSGIIGVDSNIKSLRHLIRKILLAPFVKTWKLAAVFVSLGVSARYRIFLSVISSWIGSVRLLGFKFSNDEFRYLAYMSAREKGLTKTLHLWDVILTTHPSINLGLISLFGLPPNSIQTIYPNVPKIDIVSFNAKLKKSIICTGAQTKYRMEIIDALRPSLNSRGLSIEYTAFSASKALVAESFATLNIPQHKEWANSSPNRLDRSLKKNLIPIVWKLYGDHPLEKASVELTDFLKFFPNGVDELVKRVNVGIDDYNRLASDMNFEVNLTLDRIRPKKVISTQLALENPAREYLGAPLVLGGNGFWRRVAFQKNYYLVFNSIKKLDHNIFTDTSLLHRGLVIEFASSSESILKCHSHEKLPIKHLITGMHFDAGSVLFDGEFCYLNPGRFQYSFLPKNRDKFERFDCFWSLLEHVVRQSFQSSIEKVLVFESESVIAEFNGEFYLASNKLADKTLSYLPGSCSQNNATKHRTICELIKNHAEDCNLITWKI